MPDPNLSGNSVGPNDWYIDMMYENYQDDPASVSADWREYFEKLKTRFQPTT